MSDARITRQRLTLEGKTPRARRYVTDDKNALLPGLYLRQRCFQDGQSPPRHIVVTIETDEARR
ncbi:MAG: hypothetical protein J0L81_09045 [Caulobacterales bacterium]|jgi:hypothetical protein|nr:hypothetical protein [Caulobacterales bacterium]